MIIIYVDIIEFLPIGRGLSVDNSSISGNGSSTLGTFKNESI